MKRPRGRPIAVSSSPITTRPVPVIAATFIAWAFAAALGATAIVVVASFEQQVELGSASGPQATYMLGVVTVLVVSAILLGLGALATWLRETDMILVFTLWSIAVGVVCLAAIGEPSGPARLALYALVAAAAAAPVVLLLLPEARGWLPAIPLHPVVLVLLFGPLVGPALIAVRRRENERFGVEPHSLEGRTTA